MRPRNHARIAACAGAYSSRGKGRKHFFFEKKKQKTFVHKEYVGRPNSTVRKLAKVFWFFFSKKNYFPLPSSPALRRIITPMRVIAVIPVLNEQGAIGNTLRRLPPAVVERAIVVDGGSTDGTVAEARAFGAEVIEEFAPRLRPCLPHRRGARRGIGRGARPIHGRRRRRRRRTRRTAGRADRSRHRGLRAGNTHARQAATRQHGLAPGARR